MQKHTTSYNTRRPTPRRAPQSRGYQLPRGKSRSARPSYETQSGGGSSRTAGYTMDQYAAQNDLYAEEAQQMYEPEMPAPARYEEAYRQNKAISSELLYSDKTPEFLRARVHDIQEKTYRQLLKAQERSVKAHEAVRLANEFEGERNSRYEELMAMARENVRKGQFFWDLISAENSVGFHNPAKALDTLMSSMDYSQKAVDLCLEATNAHIAANLAGDIKDIVPPILEFSRKMQQDPAVLQTNPWLKLLPVLPKAEQVWDGQEQVSAR